MFVKKVKKNVEYSSQQGPHPSVDNSDIYNINFLYIMRPPPQDIVQNMLFIRKIFLGDIVLEISILTSVFLLDYCFYQDLLV